MPPRFFPFGTRCARCEYDLTHLTRTECPECGKIQAERALDGHVGALSDRERSFASGALLKPMPFEAVYLAHMKLWRYAGAVALAILSIPAVWAVMHWDHDPRMEFRELFQDAVVVVAPFAALGYIGLMIWFVIERSRRTRRLPELIEKDLGQGVAEVHALEATHLLLIDGRGSPGAYVRSTEGCVLAVRSDASEWFKEGAGSRLELIALPRSRVIVGVRSSGEPLTLARKSGRRVRRRRLRFPRERTMIMLRDERIAFRVDDAFEPKA